MADFKKYFGPMWVEMLHLRLKHSQPDGTSLLSRELQSDLHKLGEFAAAEFGKQKAARVKGGAVEHCWSEDRKPSADILLKKFDMLCREHPRLNADQVLGKLRRTLEKDPTTPFRGSNSALRRHFLKICNVTPAERRKETISLP